MFTANIVFDKNPENYIDEELRKFSDYYQVGKKSIFYSKKYSFLHLKLYIKDFDTNNVTFYLNKSYYNIVKLLFVGSPALTSRGMKESEFAQVAEFLHQGIQIAVDIQKKTSKC